MQGDFDVKALRERIGWKQERLARYLDIPRSSVSHLENGRKLKGPVLKLLKALADAADRSAADSLCPESTGESS